MKRWKLITPLLLLPLVALAVFGGWPAWQRYQVERCLPDGVGLGSVAVSGPVVCKPKYWALHRVGLSDALFMGESTVADELERLGAYPRAGKLYAADGAEIVVLVEDGRVDYEDWKFAEKHVIVVSPANTPVE
ncbi:hypothetical protein AYO44_08190 [Planctomycetaceae bacterium SCGC AG-212-F19]|nr:hypothetical protein AYO44_08190 [Planctomycetaceae bacterium SCGC AG-212-F19]